VPVIPIAALVTFVGILVTLVGIILQNTQQRRTRDLEEQRFKYEQSRWREDLGREMIIKLFDERVVAYTKLWGYVRVASLSNRKDLSKAKTQEIAGDIREWRYGEGGLLAEDITRDAALQLQGSLWEYADSKDECIAFDRMRDARRLVLRSLRADLGLGKNVFGKKIYEIFEERQQIGKEIENLKQRQMHRPE
jgi:hypothetical protein